MLYFTRDGHYEIKPSEGNHLETPSKLTWNLTNKVKEVIQQSAADLDRWAVRHVSLSLLFSLHRRTKLLSHLSRLFTELHLAHVLGLLSQDMFPVFLVCCASMKCTLDWPFFLELYSSIFLGFRRVSSIHLHFLHLMVSSMQLWRVVHMLKVHENFVPELCL